MRISGRFLLGLYLVAPLSLAVVILDQFIFGQTLKGVLPFSPQDLLLFNIFFVYPHIFASALQFADTEYIQAYKTRLAWGIPLIAAGTYLAPQLLGYENFLFLFGAYTVYHVVGQQFGLVRPHLKQQTVLFGWWKWIGVAISLFLLLLTFPPTEIGFDLRPYLYWLTMGFFIPWLAIGVLLSNLAKSPTGVWNIWVNHGMVAACFTVLAMGYPFFSILIPRFIHDLTAFTFYIVHDVNRNREKKLSFVSKFAYALRLPLLVVGPVVAMIVALPFTLYSQSNKAILFGAFAFSIFHYYTESFVWKRESPHRQHVGI